ncbi:MAG: TetR/AcrR family transcriptional regulator [Cyanobacteria bacterium P01_G01_bin.54]
MNTTKKDVPAPGKPKSKGRPRHFDRDEALNLALQVFYENGFEATSIAQLSKAMKMKPPSLYNAFGDKEQLFIEVLEHYHQPYQESVRQIFLTAANAPEAIRQLMEKSKNLHTTDNPIGCLVVNSTVNVGSEDSPIAEKIKSLHDTTEQLIYQRLKEGQQKGEISASVKVTKLARYVCGILLGAAALARGQKSPAAVKDLLDQGYQGFLSLAGLT